MVRNKLTTNLKKNEKLNYISIIVSVVFGIPSSIASIIFIVEFYQNKDLSLIKSLLLVISLIIIWIITLYISFRKSNNKKIFPKKIRYTLLGIASLLTLSFIIYLLLPKFTFQTNINGILVLQIEGDDQNNSLQNDLISTLNDMLTRESKEKIEVRGLGKSVNEINGLSQAHQEARSIGRKVNAKLVIWGNRIGDNKFHPRLTIVENKISDSETQLSNITIADQNLSPANLSEFNLPVELIKRPICLINIIIGYDYYINKKFKQAIFYFEKAGENSLSKEEAIPILFFIAGGNINLYREFMDEGFINKAIIICNSLIKITTGNLAANAYNNRGVAFFLKNDFVSTINDYSKAIELNPKEVSYYLNRGNSYFHKSKFRLSINDYSIAIKLDPTEAIYYRLRGLAYLKIGIYDSCIADCDEAIKIKPQNTTAYINKGNALFNLKKYNQSIINYTKALEINPNIAEAYNNRGGAYLKTKNYKKSLEDLNHAILLNGNYDEAYYNRGNLYIIQDLYKLAIKDYSNAIEINPNHSDAYYKRGLSYANLEENDSAI